MQKDYLHVARRFIEEGNVDSIRVSARPDQLATESLCFLYDHGVRTVEIGVQSLSEEVLHTARRGHSASEALEALERAKRQGMEVGAQIMVGLPGDSMRRAKETIEKIIRTTTDFVRISPVLVVKDTELERMYREGVYQPLTIEDAVSICKDLVALLEEASIKVIRIGLHEYKGHNGQTPAWVAGPHHPSFGHLVRAAIFMDKAAAHLHTHGSMNATASFRIHPNDRSLFQGHRSENIAYLSGLFDVREVKILEDPTLPRGSVQYVAET